MNQKKSHTSAGFTVPKNYFSDLNHAIIHQLETEKSCSNDNGFTVPKNYFNSLNATLYNKISVPIEKPITPLYKRPWVYQAISIAAIFVISIIGFLKYNTTNEDLNSLDLASIENYIASGQLEFDEYDLVNLYDISATELNTVTTIELDPTQVLEYLSEEEIDYINDL